MDEENEGAVCSPTNGHYGHVTAPLGVVSPHIYNKDCILSLYKSLFTGIYLFQVITVILQSYGPNIVIFSLVFVG